MFARLRNRDGSDGGWRISGQTHGPGPDNAACAADSNYSNVWDAIAHIEAELDIDVTPCTDASGAWAPVRNAGSSRPIRATLAELEEQFRDS